MYSKMHRADFLRRNPLPGGQAGFVQPDDLARLHLAQEGGANRPQRARLGRRHPAAPIQFSQAERAQAPRVAHGVDGLARENGQRISPARLLHKSGDALIPGLARRAGQHLGDDLAIRGGTQPDASLQQVAPQGRGIGQVAVVGDAQRAECGFDQVRLGIGQAHGAGRGIARVADRQVPLQKMQVVFVENLGHQPQPFVDGSHTTIARGDPGAFLPPMLQGIQRKERQPGHFRSGRIDGANAARFMSFIIIKHIHVKHPLSQKYQLHQTAQPYSPLRGL